MKNLIKTTARPILAAALLGTVLTPASADEKQLAEQFPAFVADTFEQLDLHHGASVAVIKGDQIIYTGVFGNAHVKNKIRVTADTSFYIASSTKPFTGLAALLLAEKGMLDLDKSLAAFFPEVTFDPSLNADKITIRHLLAHTHGLDNDPISFAAAYTGNHTAASLLEMLKHTKSNEKAPFGTYDYTNLGYNLFSMILEREFNTPWQDILAREVFAPLGTTRTSSYMSDVKKNGWPLAAPYVFAGPNRDDAVYLVKKDNTMHAAGGMVASATDMARFVQAQLNEGRVDHKQTFPANVINASQAKLASFDDPDDPYFNTGYGMGWTLGSFGGESFVHHFGGFAGSNAHMSFMPEHDLGLIILMNEGQVAQPLSEAMAGYVYDMMLDKDGVDEARRAEIATLAKRISGARINIAKHYEDLAARTWQMSLPFTSYTGSYSNPLYGTVNITEIAPEKLKVQLGNMHAVATPFNKPDALRLELVPGRGRGLTFDIDGTNIKSLSYDGTVYIRD